MHIGDIYKNHIDGNKNLLIIFILAMNKKKLEEVKSQTFESINLTYEKKMYIKDNDDNFEVLTNSSLEKANISHYYAEKSAEWKPFFHLGTNSENKTIEDILIKIFENRVTEVRWFYFDENISFDKFIENDNHKGLFSKILEKSIFVIDPISLSHHIYRELFEEIYYNAEIGGILTTSCEFLPPNLKLFSTILLKRLGYRWHRNWQKHKSLIHFKINDEKSLGKYLIDICEKLGYNVSYDFFKDINREPSNETIKMNRFIS